MVAKTRSNIAYMLFKLQKYPEALQMIDKALEIYREKVSQDDLDRNNAQRTKDEILARIR